MRSRRRHDSNKLNRGDKRQRTPTDGKKLFKVHWLNPAAALRVRTCLKANFYDICGNRGAARVPSRSAEHLRYGEKGKQEKKHLVKEPEF